jgi:hypothetical protein
MDCIPESLRRRLDVPGIKVSGLDFILLTEIRKLAQQGCFPYAPRSKDMQYEERKITACQGRLEESNFALTAYKSFMASSSQSLGKVG